MRPMQDEDIFESSMFVEDDEEVFGITMEEIGLGDYENDIDVEVHYAKPQQVLAAEGVGAGGIDSFQGTVFYALLGALIIFGILYINLRGQDGARAKDAWRFNFRLRALEDADRALGELEEQARASPRGATGLQEQLQRVSDCLVCVNGVVKDGESAAQVQQAEALLKRLDSLLGKFHSASPQSDLSAHAALEDFLLEAKVSQRISLLRAESAAVGDAVCHLLCSHVQNSLRKCVFDLQQDLDDGAHFVEALRASRSLQLGASSTEFEVTTRRVTSGLEVLRAYDTSQAHDGLRDRAAAYLRVAHAMEDEMSRRLFEAREANELLLLKQSMNAISDAGSSGYQDAKLAINDVTWRDTGAESDSATASAVSADKASRSDSMGSLSASISSEQVAFFKQMQAKDRVHALTDKFVRSAEDTKERRLEQRLRAQTGAETRYRQDYQAERDEKSRLSAMAVQQSLLRNADRVWLQQREKELTDAFHAQLKKRITRDAVVFFAVALLSTLVYAALAYGCKQEHRFLDQLLAAARTVCSHLAADCRRQGQGEPQTLSLGDVDRLFKEGMYGDIPGLLYGKARLSSVWAVQSILGWSWDGSSPIAEFGLCFYHVFSKLLLPMLASKLFTFIGLPQAATLILWTAVLLTFVGPLRSLLGALRQFSVMLLVQAGVFAAAYFFDTKLRWHVHGQRPGRGAAAKAYDVRMPLLCVAYPLLFLAAALHLGGRAASDSFSRGLRIGYSQGLLASISEAMESIRLCLQR